MPTPAQIEKQIQLEREAIRIGLQKLRENTAALELKDYASSSVYGVATLNCLLPLVIKEIKRTASKSLKEGRNGVAFKEIQKYLVDIDAESVAAIACKIAIDKIFGFKDDSNRSATVTEAIGHAVESECQMRFYEDRFPGLLRKIKENYWHRSCGTQQKLTIIKTLINRIEDEKWESWGRINRVKLGGWLLDCIMKTSGWFMKVSRRRGKKSINYIEPTPEFLKIKEQVMANAELFSPLAWPMLIEPNDWTNDRQGGYLLNEIMKGHDMVRRGDQQRIQGETPIQFLNHIQKVAYRLNPFIVDVAETLMNRGISVGKFVPIIEIPLPPKPFDIADNYDARKDYRRRAAEVMNENAQSFKRSCRTRMTMESVARFKDQERFYIPWSFDYRGRAYPIPAFLTPQDTDFGKSLLRFADESFMTPEAEEWLAFQVATTYGLDKAPMQERLQWVADNKSLIHRVATDPYSTIGDWEAADEPWQFLAACEEYNAIMIDCTRHFTGLMVATDATCSGLQILAGLARDRNTAKLVNVIPSERPQDAYKVIAESALPDCPDVVKPHMDRKVTKRTVMTVPYNAKPFSNRSYIREALKEKGVEVETTDLTQTVNAVRAAMYRMVPGPMAVMDWIEKEVANAFSRGAEKLEWTTPSGFVVNQCLMKKKIQRVQLQLLGSCNIFVATDDEGVDVRHHRNATAPNLIHSMDASLLHLSALKFEAPIALIHDSVLCRATDMATLSQIIRETYMHLFAEHDYLNDFAKQIGAETPPPIIGDLEPESVIESTYFFC